MRILSKTVLTLLLLAVLVDPFFSSVQATEETIILDNPKVYQKKERPAVTFPHKMHMRRVDCMACHHDYNAKGENMLDKSELEETDPAIRCASCHAGNSKVDLKDAFHQQCIGCHHQMRQSGEATAPELCGECHRK